MYRFEQNINEQNEIENSRQIEQSNYHQTSHSKSQYIPENYFDDNEIEFGTFGSQEHASQYTLRNQRSSNQNNIKNKQSNYSQSTQLLSNPNNNNFYSSQSSQSLSQNEKTAILMHALQLTKQSLSLKGLSDNLEQYIELDNSSSQKFEFNRLQLNSQYEDDEEIKEKRSLKTKQITKDKNQSTTNICRELFLPFIKKETYEQGKYSEIMSRKGIEESKFEDFCLNQFSKDKDPKALQFNQDKFKQIIKIKNGEKYYRESKFLITLIEKSYNDLTKTILNNNKYKKQSKQYQLEWLNTFFKNYKLNK